MKEYDVLELKEIKDAISRYCVFSLGKEIILQLTPSYNELIVRRELTRTKETLALVIHYGSFPFAGLKDITGPLETALKDGICHPLDLLDIAQHAQTCAALQAFLKESELATEEITDLVASLQYSLPLSTEITRCIDGSGEVNDNASSKLKGLRKSLHSCEAELHKSAERFIHANASKLSDTITTIRNDRIVVLVRNSDKNTIGGFIHGESNSGQTVYMEPESLLALNNQRQTILSSIEEEIERILFELSQQVKKIAEAYLSNLYTLALLDSYHAKAQWAKVYDGTVAELGDSLILNKARHPLIDQKQVVANTYRITPSKNMLLITGPNTGGKTVTLKTIGLFVLMTMCGMAISVEDAVVPLFDHVYVDIGDNQSITESLSTFSAHLKQLAGICEHATDRSLILLDEPGGGTDPQEGECLAIAVLDYLREKKAMTVVTTHYSRLKTYGKKYPEILVASVQFDQEALRPTYRYLEGITGQSNALEIAERFGLKPEIIQRARELKISGRTREEALLEQLEASLSEARRKETELDEAKAALHKEETELKKQLDFYQNQKERLLDEAKASAEQYLTEAMNEADTILKAMRTTQTDGQLHEAIALRHKLEEEAEPQEEKQNNDHTFAIGDYVAIHNTNQKGVIETLDKKKASVNVKGLKIQARLLDLDYLGQQPVVKKEKSRYKVSRPDTMSFELNLIGYRVEEALPILDKYLDDAVLMSASYLRVIHGFGTGALRQAIWKHLKNNRYIEDLRLGMQQEGGSGATIITLKKKV